MFHLRSQTNKYLILLTMLIVGQLMLTRMNYFEHFLMFLHVLNSNTVFRGHGFYYNLLNNILNGPYNGRYDSHIRGLEYIISKLFVKEKI